MLEPRILILTAADPSTNPRPRRMIENLKEHFELFAMGIGCGEIEGVKTFSFPSYQKRNFWQECLLYVNVLFSRWEKLIWTKNRQEIFPILQEYTFDAIICFDLPLLPIVLKYKKDAKVIFDAQEYFPLWMTSDKRWNLLFKRFNNVLCQTFLPQADCVLSVSPNFVERYGREFKISPIYYPSLPYFYNLPPLAIQSSIKILYHGSLSFNRSIEQVVELIDYLEDHFELHLVLVGGEMEYKRKIKEMIFKRQAEGKKIFLLSPVSFEEIIPFGNAFDIGLYFMPPKTYNLLCTIPNKIFEYIGSSLMLASTPNPDVSSVIKQHKVGKVSKDFSLKEMADLLNSLDHNEIWQYKKASYQASKELNNTSNQAKILKILDDLFEKKMHNKSQNTYNNNTCTT